MIHFLITGNSHTRPYLCKYRYDWKVDRKSTGHTGSRSLLKVSCVDCLMLWDTWLNLIQSEPPHPRGKDLRKLYTKAGYVDPGYYNGPPLQQELIAAALPLLFQGKPDGTL